MASWRPKSASAEEPLEPGRRGSAAAVRSLNGAVAARDHPRRRPLEQREVRHAPAEGPGSPGSRRPRADDGDALPVEVRPPLPARRVHRRPLEPVEAGEVGGGGARRARRARPRGRRRSGAPRSSRSASGPPRRPRPPRSRRGRTGVRVTPNARRRPGGRPGSRPAASSGGSSRVRGERERVEVALTSQAAPGYVLSRQTPPTASARSNTTRPSTPSWRRRTAAPRPAKPVPTMATRWWGMGMVSE